MSSSITAAVAASLAQLPLGGGDAETDPLDRGLMLCLSHLQGQPGPAGPQGPPGADGVKASLRSNCGLLTPKWATAINWFS